MSKGRAIKMKKMLLILAAIFLLGNYLSLTAFAEEQLTITTYYPSPYGNYRELRAQRMAVGDTYIDGSTYCWGTGCGGANVISEDTSLVVEGNVGIGTVTPAAALHIRKNNRDMAAVFEKVEGGNNWNYLRFRHTSNAGLPIGSNQNMDVWGIGVNPNENFFIGAYNNSTIPPVDQWLVIDKSSGNVGIGTTTPWSKLQVNGGIRATRGEPANQNQSNVGYSFDQDGDTGMFRSLGANDITGGDLVFVTDVIERLRIKTSGKVGIGTSDPQAKLDVSGDGDAIIVPRKSTAGDPTGVNGMIYYNSSSKKFRVFENGSWRNM
jgi:hypothetical protein